MKRTPWLTAARILLLTLLAVNAYRALTQSLTTDEAMTFQRSVLTPLAELWKAYDANDHVLYTLLAKRSVALLGQGEFAIRLPALLGGALYFWVILRLAILLNGTGPAMFVSVAFLSLNPFILDHASVARGYGLATALLLLALLWILEHRHLTPIALVLALAVAANLTVLIPGLALAAVAAFHYRKHIVEHLIIPGAVATATLLVLPLRNAERQNFYVGAPSLLQSASSLAASSLVREGQFASGTPWQSAFLTAVDSAAFLLPLILIPALVLGYRKRDLPLLAPALVAAGSIAALIFLHQFGMPYPYKRTGLYFAPLLSLTALALLRLRQPATLLLTPLLLQFLFCFQTRSYEEWIFDAGTKQLIRQIPPGTATLQPSWHLLNATRYYQRRFRLHALTVVPSASGLKPGHDFYLLLESDSPKLDQFGLRTLAQHPVSRVILAASSR